MSTFTRVIYLGALAGLLMGIGGCEDHHRYRGGEGYRYEHGDRVDSYGHREMHWCANHPEDEHCH